MAIPCRRFVQVGVGRDNPLYATTRLLGAEVSSQTLIRLETGGENIGNRPTRLQVATVARLTKGIPRLPRDCCLMTKVSTQPDTCDATILEVRAGNCGESPVDASVIDKMICERL